jgi:hypothetical protein
VVGRLVEHQQVDPARLQQCDRRPRALARRQRRGRPADVTLDAEAELRQQVRTSAVGQSGTSAREGVGERRVALERRARLVDLADHDARAELTSPTSAGCARAAAPSSVDLPAPLGPVTATRSRTSSCRSTGPSVNVRGDRGGARHGDDVAGSRRCGDRELQLPLLARLVDHVQPLESRSVWRALAACFSVCSVRNLRPILSLSRALRRAFLTPFSIHARCGPRARLQLARRPAYSS